MPLLGFQHDYDQCLAFLKIPKEDFYDRQDIVSEKRSAVEFVFVLLTENIR